MWKGAILLPNFCFNSRIILSKSAFSLSILLIKIILGSFFSSTASKANSVPIDTSVVASTTIIAPAAAANPDFTSPTKSE